MKVRWKRMVRENLGWKALSLVFAVALWLYVSTGTTPTEAPREASLELKNLPDRLVRTSEIVPAIELRLSGPRGMIAGIRNADLRYEIDLADALPGPTTARILPTRIQGLPAGVRVTEISPSQVTIHLEEKVDRKDVPVSIETRGEVAEGYEVVDKLATPRYVAVRGPKGEVVRTRTVSTEAIGLDGRKESFEGDVALDLVGRHVEASLTQVRARIEIRPKIATRAFRDVPVAVVGTVLDARVEPATLTFTVKGPAASLAAIQARDVRLFVDAQGLRPGTHSLKPQIEAPPDAEVVNLELPAVRVILRSPGKGKK
jgi:YbbR domain-containing protein